MKYPFIYPVLYILISLKANAITPEEVVTSSMKHAPQVIKALQKIKEAEAMVSSSKGAFDTKIKSKINLRTDGFYSGDLYRAQIQKSLPFANSKVYAGGRQSFGDFPDYEGKFETQSSGEIFAGLSLSFLRGFNIDENRYRLQNNKQDLLQEKIKTEKVKIALQTIALKSYWTWLIKGHEYKVFTNILKLAQSRAWKISKRIKAGDLAKIYGIENDQYIKKWEAESIRSRMEFKQASYYLSLFYRDANGAPKTPQDLNLPNLSFKSLNKVADNTGLYNTALNNSLDLQKIRSKEKQASLDIKLGANYLLPKIDLNLELSQDKGVGSPTLDQFESRVQLNFEIPLQFRKGQGKLKAGKAKLAGLKNQKRLIKDKVSVNTKSLIVKLNSFSDLYKVTNEQVELSKKLAQAERKKFFRGASDLILVNLRDENLAQAQIKNLSSRLKYQFIDAEIKNILVDFITN